MAAQTEFLITASADGHIKFWKKQPVGVEFAKHYKARPRDGPRSGRVAGRAA